MNRGQKTPNVNADQFDGYPAWRRAERVERLRRCFAIIPLATLGAISGKNAVVKVGVALYCQATMQGRKKKIVPYTEWRKALGVSKRSYFRAISTLERRHLIRRHPKGPGRKAVIELLGPLAQFPKSRRGKAPTAHHTSKAPTAQQRDANVWDHLSGANDSHTP
jgi:hypothetical protein